MKKIKELYEKVAGDSALQAKFTEIMKGAEEAGEVVTGEKLVAFAKEAGYDVTIEECREFFMALAEKAEGEISDTELDMVAGGKRDDEIAISIVTVLYGCGVISVSKEGKMICENPNLDPVTR